MTRVEKSKWTRDFYRALAVELDSHLGNGSEFIYIDPTTGEDVSAEIADLRVRILKQEVTRLKKLGSPL